MTMNAATSAKMTALPTGRSRADASLGGILLAAVAGIVLLFFAGFANSAVLHDTAHDTRHATGFPCH